MKRQVFDYFTATLGLSTELAVQDDDGEEEEADEAFSHLAKSIGASMECKYFTQSHIHLGEIGLQG